MRIKILKQIFILFNLLLANRAFAAGETGEVLKDTGKQAVVGGAVSAGVSAAGKAGLEKISKGSTGKLGDFFDSPPGILLVSGIATVYSSTLYSAAAEQEEESNDNIKKIDRLIATYKDSWINYCPNGRDNLSEPDCYCYLDGGGQNPNRTKSKICTDLWAKNSYKISAIAGDYSSTANKLIDPVGCLTLNGQFDENCKCKKFVDNKGNNACAKTTSITIPGGSFGNSFTENTGIKDVLRFGANAANGNPRFDVFSSAALGAKAIKAGMFTDQVVTKLAGAGPAPVINYADEKNALSLAKQIFGEKRIEEALKNAAPSALMATAAEPKDKATTDLLKSAAAKAGIESYGSGRGLQNKKVEAKEGMNFNFMGDQANAAGVTQNFPEQEKNYNYKGSDISKASDTSIFEIISNRYIQSGLKRLFEEEK